MTRSRNYQVLSAAKAVARALGHDPADANLLAIQLAAEGRLDWDNSELLLLALEHLADLAGLPHVAETLGVTPEQARELTGSPDFPAPPYVLASGALWSKKDITAWRQAGR
ncbi:hypothetical protein [Herbidospora mongoliensis]|uniref:hypothetical protein n=1 Tax=Herbidospora mongoliensis TaxID=688067 RepID=UPI00082E2E5B|nr:hypothetical protein [Herbidospora mongoliensis]